MDEIQNSAVQDTINVLLANSNAQRMAITQVIAALVQKGVIDTKGVSDLKSSSTLSLESIEYGNEEIDIQLKEKSIIFCKSIFDDVLDSL